MYRYIFINKLSLFTLVTCLKQNWAHLSFYMNTDVLTIFLSMNGSLICTFSLVFSPYKYSLLCLHASYLCMATLLHCKTMSHVASLMTYRTEEYKPSVVMTHSSISLAITIWYKTWGLAMLLVMQLFLIGLVMKCQMEKFSVSKATGISLKTMLFLRSMKNIGAEFFVSRHWDMAHQ